VCDLVQKNRLPRIIAIPWDADQREGVRLPQQAAELDAVPPRGWRVAGLI
jgi:hypothetical protein